MPKSSGMSARAFGALSFHGNLVYQPAPTRKCAHCGSDKGFDVRPVVIDAENHTLDLCATDRMPHRIGAVIAAAKEGR